MPKASLNGRVLAFVESRMPDAMANLIQRHGGEPRAAPVLQEIYLKDSSEVRQAVTDACAGRVDIAIFLTGVGAQAFFATANAMGCQDEFAAALRNIAVVARSPKPGRILRQHKIPITIMPPEPYTSHDLTASMSAAGLALAGKKVVVQRYGGPDAVLPTFLRQQGADFTELTLYNWGLHQDQERVVRLIDQIIAGQVDAIAFTSRPQIPNLFAIAQRNQRDAALLTALQKSVPVASVGPVCTQKLVEMGIPVAIEPEHPHMGNLVLAVADYFDETAPA